MTTRAINIEVIKAAVADFILAVRKGDSVQGTVNRMVAYKRADDLISAWAGEVDAQSADKDEKNKILSKFRTQLRRAAEAHELDKFPSVKKSGQSYAVVWKDWPAEASDVEQAFNEAVAAFRKLPNDENREAMDKAADAYAKAAKESNAAPEDKISGRFDATFEDAGELDADEIDEELAMVVNG